MPAKKKASDAAAGQQAKRTRTKSTSHDESVSPVAADPPPGMSTEFHVIGSAQGFEVRARDTVEDLVDNPTDTTTEVDFKAVALGEQMEWFIEQAAKWEADEMEYPHSSHGFSAVLTNVHRGHPKLAFAWEVDNDKGEIEMVYYDMISYESAGTWRDTEGETCLVVRADYGDGEVEVHMLTEAMRVLKMPKNRKATKATQWVVLDEGTGGHLTKGPKGGYIVCDNPTKAPDA